MAALVAVILGGTVAYIAYGLVLLGLRVADRFTGKQRARALERRVPRRLETTAQVASMLTLSVVALVIWALVSGDLVIKT